MSKIERNNKRIWDILVREIIKDQSFYKEKDVDTIARKYDETQKYFESLKKR